MGRRSLAGLALGLLSALLTACGDPYRGEPVYGPLFGPLSERSSDAVAAGAPDQVSLAEGRRVVAYVLALRAHGSSPRR